jgi:SpoVK/Ycf46/Vps4 family AAA+-type ATPase
VLLDQLLGTNLTDRLLLRQRLLHPQGALLGHGLVRLRCDDLQGETPRLRATLPLIAALAGGPVPDLSLEGISSLHPRERLAVEQLVLPASLSERFWRFYPTAPTGDLDAAPPTYWPVVLVTGPQGVGKTAFVHAVAARLGHSVREVACDRLAAGRHSHLVLERLEEAALVGREVLHLDAALALVGREAPGRYELGRLLLRHRVPVFLEVAAQSNLDPGLLDRVDIVVPLGVPLPGDRAPILASHLPPDAGGGAKAPGIDLPAICERYELGGRALARAAHLAGEAARRRAPQAPVVTAQDLDAAVALQLHGDLGEMSERRPLLLRLEDLVLPRETMEQIVEILQACQVRAQVLSSWGFGRRLAKGRGLCLLFHGDPGTGKTHCAEVLAMELGLELYQVSLPRIVSKWVGETERNIERIFIAARQSRAVLLFDEADSLLASRTRVESANDRWANMETNYLLQQIEHYDGIVILTTNLVKNLDPAMERRIAYRVEFPFPDAESRALIWETLIPREAPLTAGVDFAQLGRDFELSGGHIKNAVLRAACRAMAAGGKLTMAALREAAETEYHSRGRLVQQR